MKARAKPKVLLWDIEATNLSAPFGTILCIGYKWLGEKKVYVPTILDFAETGHRLSDEVLVDHFAEVYAEADYTVAHYGVRYDLPMVNSKLIKYGKKPLPPIPMIDTWWIARTVMKMHSNRLGAIAEYLSTKNAKTPITFDDWLQAAAGNHDAIKQVVKHCKADVLTLEEVFIKLRPWIKMQPASGLFSGEITGCVNCGGFNVHNRGFHVTKTKRFQRRQCQDCGKWQRSSHADLSIKTMV